MGLDRFSTGRLLALALAVFTLVLAFAAAGADPLVRFGLFAAGLSQTAIEIWAIRARGDERERIARLTDTARRIHEGEEHLFAAIQGDDSLARLGAAVNQLAGDVRDGHLEAESQRVLAEAMVRETPNGLMVLDSVGTIRSCNPAFLRLIPVDGEVLGRKTTEVLRVPELLEVIEESTRTRSVSERPATVGVRDLLFRGMPLPDGAGCMAVVLDITSVRLAERARRDFVANVSHELRTPVTALVGYAEALLEDRELLAPGMAPMVEAIARNAQRLHLLVDDVLQLSKIEARQGDLPLAREPIAPAVRDVVERFVGVARQRGMAIRVDVAEELTASINEEAFDHALGNLVDNAIKYGAVGSEVRISARPEGRWLCVDVEDHGSGIDPIHHPRIFERFYRGDPARSRTIPGTGLGLALVKHLCLAMGAEVRFTSSPGLGSTFALLLPE